MPPPGSLGARGDPGPEHGEGNEIEAEEQVGGRVESRRVLASQPEKVKESTGEAMWELASGPT